MDADEVGDGHLLLEHRLLAVDRVDVPAPEHGFVRHAEGAEHLVVEPVRAEEQLLDPLEEESRLGPLDDPVVVGRADRDDLGDPEVGERDGIGGLPLRGVVEAAHADDEALAGHEARHRLLRADRARVREAHRGADEVVGAELVRPHLADELLVGAPEASEVELVGVAHDRHEERAAAVGLLHVDRDAEAHVLVADHPRLALRVLDVGGVHDRHRLVDRLDDGVADEVGEGHLPAPGATEVAVDDPAVDLEQLGRDAAEARRRGDLEAGLHVGDDAGRGAADRLADRSLGRLAVGGRRRRGGRRGRGAGGGRRRAAGAGAGAGAAHTCGAASRR